MDIRVDGKIGGLRNVIKSGAAGKKADVSKAKAKADGVNADKADFVAGQTSVEDRQLTALRSKILGDVAGNTDEARLAELKEAISKGAYSVSTDDLVGAMLRFMR